ncbi:hypothetical protein [Halomicronema hongdechloris]|uniref:hypothetical protein n=1 Tax=Halomicronema hongdechloris TaxID=1209493 RepID=UPI001650E8AF|nr:hypothetical protein [Halomicronema hongdechloris]
MSDPTHYYALLVIPWVCLILGWTYVVNDEKISSFWYLVANPPIGVIVLSWAELILLIALGVETFIYADLAKGH